VEGLQLHGVFSETIPGRMPGVDMDLLDQPLLRSSDLRELLRKVVP
jgi:hypothetical protein